MTAPYQQPVLTLAFPNGQIAPSVLSVAQLALLFGISEGSIYDAIKAGELYARKFTARRYRIALADAWQWFNAERAQ